MSNTFTKNGFRGFTLIELLVVIAIIGLLSTIIAAPIQSARKKARDAKKIAELKSTELALEQYAESNSAQYPSALSALSPQFMPVLSGFTSSTTSNPRDAFAYSFYEASASGAATTTFSYHIGVKLEVYGPALETDRDCILMSLSNALAIPFCSVYNGNIGQTTLLDNGSQILGTTTPLTIAGKTVYLGTNGNLTNKGDFIAFVSAYSLANSPGKGVSFFTEDSSSTCVNINECIFDVTSQQ